MSKLDYQALIYASIVHTQWRGADLQKIEAYMRQRYGILGHMSVEEFRTAAVIAAQAQIERPAVYHEPWPPVTVGEIVLRDAERWSRPSSSKDKDR